METNKEKIIGLSTEEAFDRLFQELGTKLSSYRSTVGSNWLEIILSSISTRSHHAIITWTSLLILLVESIIVFSLYSINYSQMWTKLLPEAITLLFLLIFNILLLLFDNYKRVNELPVKLNLILSQLKDISSEVSWTEKNYPDLCMPISPCITLQWCFRDGKLVNLPWALLVPGDVVVLQPSQKIVAECCLLEEPSMKFSIGQIYSPLSSAQTAGSPPPRLHNAFPKSLAVVTTAPYIDMVDLSLKHFLRRPPTFYNKERHTIVTRIIECIVLPLGIMSFVALCLVRMFYLPHWLAIRVAPWADIILLQPMTNTFPLIPVSLPLLWILLNCVGNAKLWEMLEVWDDSATQHSPSEGTGGMEEKVVLNKRKQQCRDNVKLWQRMREFMFDREETLHRSQKLLHVLASVTALCCVDKKGILSWPNPTPDKIFFLRSVPTGSNLITPDSESPQPKDYPGGLKKNRRSSTVSFPSTTTVAEVLDITIDNNNELHFDETNWEQYLPNLKPLGLNILLNTCNDKTRRVYANFYSHISHELRYKKADNRLDLVVPVTSRRCLCDVAHMIGFGDKATDVFDLEQPLCSFRHIESDQTSRDKLTKAKIKFPFPHMMSVIVREKASGSLQLMAQGTGDLILDTCEDFWDGKDLKPLTDYERKLIIDFYQRMSLSSTCTAFSYKPVTAKVNQTMSDSYMELPPSKGLRFLPYYAFGNISDFINERESEKCAFVAGKDSSISTDCLLTDSNKNIEVSDLLGCLQVQTGQIFIGMVTMQYQACMDMVQLIEQLDQACIRFVHFSKENELRSRLFSEKMGLESGWNCHISLSSAVEESSEATDNYDESNEGSYSNGNPSNEESRRLIKGSTTSAHKCKSNRLCQTRSACRRTSTSGLPSEDSLLLPRCSSSVPEMVMLSTKIKEESEIPESTEPSQGEKHKEKSPSDDIQSIGFGFSSDEEEHSQLSRVRFEDPIKRNFLSLDVQNTERSPCSSAVMSPNNTDSFQEVYELVEHPTPLGIDMSNRAKLPIGIEQVRPHLENVDNVPLLVSLFTDCTADNTREMIHIMQDYGEVTLLLGSVCNADNKTVFLQADASISVEPMFPQSCQKTPAFSNPSGGVPAPSDVAMLLTSLPSSLTFRRRDYISFYDLVAQARHFMNRCIRNSMQYWLCCNIAVTVLGLFTLLMLLPPLFALGDAIWLSCAIIPVLTLGLAFSIMEKVDYNVMDNASWKNQCQVDRQMFIYAFWFYGMKFLPSILNVVFMASFNLVYICQNLPNATCAWVYPVSANPVPPIQNAEQTKFSKEAESISVLKTNCISTWSCENADRLLFVQQFSLFFLVLYFVTISAGFVYRSKYIWVLNPLGNKIWVITSIFVLISQFMYGFLKVSFSKSIDYTLLPIFSYIWGFLWSPILLAFNEILRRQEIKSNIRYEKRARLDFGTKLGMNSPF
ncbi:hypothetical protein Ocin01_01491 [Orchesella cincta]|uniref:Transmembrane protein 94 n=1 Tax=Orchesella cincta TaxID=48709 RepID=A0A1D2NIX0_ORCCI|nr:hypothetical protein Ocin01_01491 [Orchesella cincta]